MIEKTRICENYSSLSSPFGVSAFEHKNHILEVVLNQNDVKWDHDKRIEFQNGLSRHTEECCKVSYII